jgi:pilus assembly protein FimV
MRKQLSRLVLLGALLSPPALYALGLGELKLNSALNQPFDAEIELIAPTSEELAELKVALANNEAFARYGLDRPAFLSNFGFEVTRNRDGRSAIKVTSSSSVTEPFVTLLVEVVSGRGRLLREYTVLLDPPVELPNQPENQPPVTTTVAGSTTGEVIERPSVTPEVTPQENVPEPVAQTPSPVEAAAPVPEPVAAAEEPAPATVQPPEQVAFVPAPAPTPTPVEEPVPSPQSIEATPQPAPEPVAANGGSYTVQRNDSLSQIVRDVVRPGRGAINKAMIAMFRANPAAFSSNINRLRAGAVLRLPDISEIEAISAGEAGAEVTRQREAWGGAFTAGVPTRDAVVLVPPKDAPPTTVARRRGDNDSRGSNSGGFATNSEDLRLAIESEILAAQQRNSLPPAELAPRPGTNTLLEESGEAEAVAPDAAPPPQGEPAPLPGDTNQPSMFDRVTDFWWVPLAAGMLLGLVGFFVFLMRRRSRDPDLGDELDPPPLTFEPRIANEVQQSNRKRSRGEAFAVPNDPLPDDEEEAPAAFGERDRDRVTVFREEPVARAMPESAPAPKPKVVPPPAPVPAPRSVEDTLSSETAVRFDQQDALAEADFHMAYGLYDQAADLVKIAIDREPHRRELKLKLLEIYFVWGNRDLFLETAHELHRSRDRAAPGEWENILIMGRQIAPEESIFKGDAGARVDLVDVNLEGGENRVDVDLFAAPENSRDSLDLEFASGERAGPDSDIDYLLDETRSRDYDSLSRTQETPTIESPVLENAGQTGRMRALNGRKGQAAARNGAGAYEDVTAMRAGALRDDERTQLAPSLGNLDRTMLAPRSEDNAIYIDQVDLSQGGDTVEQRRPGRATDTFSDEVFNGGTNRFERIDLDVGDSLATEDRTATTARQARGGGMELSELEPVTMSEVGTKLDLARAYMDMGDPDGARSILEEVVEEGNVSQKQEAQRLLESVR